MRRERHPDERFHAVMRATEEPMHPHERALWRLRATGAGDDAIVRVIDAYEDAFERELLQAWIIAGASDEAINARLGIALDMLPPYRHLCCNPLVFRDRLELLRWVRNYDGSREGKLLLERAVHLDGVEAVAHMCGLPTHLEPSHVNEQVMRETYFRGVATLRGSNISSAEAAAAHQMLKTSLGSADGARKRGAPNLAETLLKLAHRDLTHSVDEVVPHGEIMN